MHTDPISLGMVCVAPVTLIVQLSLLIALCILLQTLVHIMVIGAPIAAVLLCSEVVGI